VRSRPIAPNQAGSRARASQRDRGTINGPDGWRTPFIGAAILWIAARSLITAVAVLTQFFAPSRGLLHTRGLWFFRLFFNWDSAYYQSIAQQGYFSTSSDPSITAFFPGYGLAARLVALAIDPSGPGQDAVIVALWLVSAIASLVAAVLIWRLAEDRHGRRAAIATTALFVAGPYSLFLAASYAESLFLACALAAWLCGTQERWLAAGLLCGLASAVRPNGIMLFGAMLVMYVTQRRASGRPVVSGAFAAVWLGIAGTAAYFIYLFTHTGSLLTWGTTQQQGWGRVTQWPWLSFYQTAGRILFASTPDRRIQYGLDILFAAILIAGVVYFWRARQWPAFTYLGLTALSLMTSFTYVSLARNTLLLFPLTIAVASTVEAPGRRSVFWVSLGVGLVLLVFNVHQFTLGLWAD